MSFFVTIVTDLSFFLRITHFPWNVNSFLITDFPLFRLFRTSLACPTSCCVNGVKIHALTKSKNRRFLSPSVFVSQRRTVIVRRCPIELYVRVGVYMTDTDKKVVFILSRHTDCRLSAQHSRSTPARYNTLLLSAGIFVIFTFGRTSAISLAAPLVSFSLIIRSVILLCLT